MHLMRWRQLFLRSFGLSPISFKSVGHVLLSWASWKVHLVVGIQIWGMLAMSERIFLLGHSSTYFLLTGPYARPLLFTGNLLGRFIVLEQAHGPTYYYGPLPPHLIWTTFFFGNKIGICQLYWGCIYIFIYKVGSRDRAIQGGHGPSRILFLKLKVYLFYDIFRIWANENYF